MARAFDDGVAQAGGVAGDRDGGFGDGGRAGPGTDTTFITESTAQKLQVNGKDSVLNLSTMTQDSAEVKCKVYENLIASDIKDRNKVNIMRAYSRATIPLNRDHIPTPSVASKWPHLQKIAHMIPELLDIEIGMLIGYDNAQALTPLETIVGRCHDDPFAMRTPLGWCIVGKTGINTKVNKAHVCNRTSSQIHEIASPELVINLLEQDFKDTEVHSSHAMMSQDDVKFMNMLDSMTYQQKDGHYSMSLPFRKRPVLPDNKDQGLKCLNTLRNKLKHSEKLQDHYVKFMNDVIDKGDAEVVPTEQHGRQGEQWYVPHFGVYHPKKQDKIRVVFDCSAKYKETSLNDHLLQGL